GPDDDALAPRAEPDRHPVAARLADPHAAVHVRADADGEVAVGHVDVAPDFGRDQADGAVGIADIAADLAAAADQHAAVDGFDAARGPRALADADAAIDRGQPFAGDVVAGGDAAVGGRRRARSDAVGDSDAAV